jgi:hypothetical protein
MGPHPRRMGNDVVSLVARLQDQLRHTTERHRMRVADEKLRDAERRFRAMHPNWPDDAFNHPHGDSCPGGCAD